MTVGNKNTIRRAISKKLDRQILSIQKEMQKEEDKKRKPKKISFISATTKIEVKKK